MRLKCDRKLLLYFYVVKVVSSEESSNKKSKHVANYYKQKGICLPIKLCRLNFFLYEKRGVGYHKPRIF